ncbi:tetratricopeptide repeat protein [Brasilonema sp. CT11]|nr:tetratricopeptide repeat protein [Brasilonema sp. CT11]
MNPSDFKSLRLIRAILLLLLMFPLYSLTVQSRTLGTIQAQKPQNRKAEANRLFNEGVDQYNKSQFQQALKTFQKASAIYREIGDRPNLGETLSIIGNIYYKFALYKQALDSFNQALVLLGEVGDKKAIVDAVNGLGAVHDKLGESSKALSLYQQALVLAQDNGDSKRIAIALKNIGGIYDSTGKYSQALKYYQQSLTILQKIDDQVVVEQTLNSIGVVYSKMGRYPQALKFYQQALAIVKTTNNLGNKGNILNNIGLVYSELGEYFQALKYYQQALSIRMKIGDKAGVGETLHNLGFAYDDLKQDSQALKYYQQALKVFRGIRGKAGLGKTLNNIGLLYHRLGQYSQAIDSLKQSLTISKEVADRASIGRTLDSIGTVYKSLGQYSQAMELYQQALAITKDIRLRSHERIILSHIGDLLAQQNKPQLAIIFYKQSVNVTEAIRKELQVLPREQQQSYTTTIADTYRHLADLLLQQNQVLEAQQVLDLLKIQELDDYLHNVRGNEKTQEGISLNPQEQKIDNYNKTILNQEIQLGRELAELEKISTPNRKPDQEKRIADLRNIQQQIARRFKEFINGPEVEHLRRTAPREAVSPELLNSLQDNLKRLNQNAVLLYPLILDNRLELVMITPYAPPIRRQVAVKREVVTQAIREFIEALRNPNYDGKVPAKKLYEWLIKPIEKDLAAADAKTIIYAPDGQLRYIPLAALYDGKQWIAQRLSTNYITAVSLTKLNTKPLVKVQVLAGATTRYHSPFPSLRYAGLEVENLAAMIPETKKLIDAEFSHQAVSYLNDYTIVHMATHAMFVPGQAEDSFILLGDGSHMTLPDISTLPLSNVDLVVLSACETAVGGFLGNGKEILGFGYQMQDAGAKAVIASLWSVNDGGTQTLMNAFYAMLDEGHMTKAEALRQAQVAMITGNYSGVVQQQDKTILQSTRDRLPPKVASNLSHPYYWAPFILIGNGL